MAYSPEEIQVARKLAKHMAESEKRLASFERGDRETGNLAPLVSAEQKILDGDRGKIANNPLAEALLPQARIIVKMEADRERAIQRTAFGKLIDLVMTLGEFCDQPGYAEREAFKNPFENAADNEVWEGFMGNFETGDPRGMLENLLGLLVGAQRELIFAEMPPAPLTFQIPE